MTAETRGRAVATRGAGGVRAPQILAAGHIMSTTLLLDPRIFRPSYGPAEVTTLARCSESSIVHTAVTWLWEKCFGFRLILAHIVRRWQDLFTNHDILYIKLHRSKNKFKQWNIFSSVFRSWKKIIKSKFYKKRGATFFYEVTRKLGPLDFTQYRSKSSSF